MNCAAFMRGVEDYFSLRPCSEPGPAPGLPPALTAHAATCRSCAAQFERARRSRVLLAALVSAAPAETEPDPYFYTRLRARIASEARARQHPLYALGVAWRHVAVAGLLCALTVGAFICGVEITEAPKADAAIAIEVPRSSPYQAATARDGQANSVDMMVSLLIP